MFHLKLTRGHVWLAIAAGGIGLAAASLILTELFDLNPCHLCVFQRLLFFLVGVFALLAMSGRLEVVAGVVVVLLNAGGAVTAAYQSWLQAQPVGSVSCLGGDPDPIQRLVYYLSDTLPSLFAVSGFCEDEAMVILGLSLANWAVVSFGAGLVAASAALLARRRAGQQGRTSLR